MIPDSVNAGVRKPTEQVTQGFLDALKHHQVCLEQFGEDDPRSVEAAIQCMALMPASWRAEILGMALERRH